MTRKALLKDLERSGLTDREAKKLGFKPLTAKQTNERTDFAVASYLIPYYDIAGKLTDFWRVRYLDEVRGPFGAIKKKPPRYSQARDTLPRFYLPKNSPQPWKAIAENPKVGIVITEGEKKAAKACKAGIPAISIGGVWAWRSKKRGLPTIPDFDLFEWKERDVRLCFDNDLMSNPLVIGALNALAHELTKRGAVVYITYLPKASHKIGLDDYLVKRSAKSFLKLKNEPYAESAELWKLNEEIAMVTSVNAVWEFDVRRFLKTNQDYKNRYGDRIYKVAKADGAGFKEISAIEQWLKWSEKRRYRDIVYAPGEGEVVDGCINLWTGWGCDPKEGNVKPFHDLLDFLFKDEPDLLRWFWQWLAYPLQNPGAKNMTSVLLHSRAQGVGKSFVGYIMSGIYGENFVVVDHESMTTTFNSWAANKQFILGEELTGDNSRRWADRLKNMVTRETVLVNAKYQPEYELVDRANYLLTSNHVDALFLEGDDRRIAVHEIKAAPKPQPFYDRIDRWRRNGGPSHLFHYLLRDVDLTGYNPKARAPMSAAKQRMIDHSKSDLDLFAQTILEDPKGILKFGRIEFEQDLFGGDQIQAMAESYCGHHHHIHKIGVTKALARVGIERRVLFFEGGTHRLWPLRNVAAWYKRPNEKWARHYMKFIQS